MNEPSPLSSLYCFVIIAQAGLDSVTIPHSICVLTSPDDEKRSKVAVGLRDGSIIAYDWNRPFHPLHTATTAAAAIPTRVLSNPRLFKLGILPVRFAKVNDGRCSKALVFADKLWQAELNEEFEIQSVLFDNEVRSGLFYDQKLTTGVKCEKMKCALDLSISLVFKIPF